MITFYFPIDCVPEECQNEICFEHKNYEYIPIELNDCCPTCRIKINVNKNHLGSFNKETYLEAPCGHLNFYNQIWNARVIKSNNQFDINDGASCDKCSDWTPMAVANMPNGKFRCYRCRTHPLCF